MPTFFFDSHGGLWATCTSNTIGAEAFGPTGIARRAALREIGVPHLHFSTDVAAVAAEDRIENGEEWSTVTPDRRHALDRMSDLDAAITHGDLDSIRAAWARISWSTPER